MTGTDDLDGTGAATTAPEEEGESLAAALALAREALIAAHPEAIPELIVGGTVAELRASVTAARAAYARVADGLRTRQAALGSPVGAPTRTPPLNVEALSPSAKIAAGLRASRQ